MRAKTAAPLCMFSLLACILTAAPARADVIYNWHTTAASSSLLQFSSRIVVSDAAFARGSADLDFSCYTGPCAAGNNDGILSISYAFNGEYSRSLVPASAVSMTGVEVDNLHFDFTDPAGLLKGSLFTLSASEQYVSASQASLWNITLVGTDDFTSSCFQAPQCSGMTGYYRADILPLPEPAPLALLGLSIAGLVAARRQANKH